MREEGLAPPRCPFENGTDQTRVVFKIYEHAFIYLILVKNDMRNLFRISKLFDQQSSSIRSELKVTPIQRQLI